MEKKTRNVVIIVTVTLLVVAALVATFSNALGNNNGDNNASDGDDYQRWCVGDYYTYSFIANHYNGAGVLVSTEKANHTLTVISVNSTSVTIASTFDNGIRTNGTTTNDIDYKFYLLINNIQMVGKEVVQTSFGEKTLSHYNRSEPWPIYDFYVDESSGVVFKEVTSTGIDIVTSELIETNVVWVNDLAKT